MEPISVFPSSPVLCSDPSLPPVGSWIKHNASHVFITNMGNMPSGTHKHPWFSAFKFKRGCIAATLRRFWHLWCQLPMAGFGPAIRFNNNWIPWSFKTFRVDPIGAGPMSEITSSVPQVLFPYFTVPARASLRAAQRVGARRLPWQSTAELFLRSSSRAARWPCRHSRCPALRRARPESAGMRGHGGRERAAPLPGAQRHLLARPGSGGTAGTARPGPAAPPGGNAR